MGKELQRQSTSWLYLNVMCDDAVLEGQRGKYSESRSGKSSQSLLRSPYLWSSQDPSLLVSVSRVEYSPSQVATELPSCALISVRAAQRRGRRQWWRGEEGARRPGPKGQVLSHVLRHVLRNVLRQILRRVLHVLVLHVSPKGSVGAACVC